MDSNCRKLGETPYRECRKQAAIYNDALGSMERAAEMLGVSVNTLSNYELGVTVPPVNIIIVMADLYRAPQLKTMYCKNECLIGRCMPVAVKAGNIDNIVIRIIKQFKESRIEGLKDKLIGIAEDGKVSEEEEKELNEICQELDEMVKTVWELKLVQERECSCGITRKNYKKYKARLNDGWSEEELLAAVTTYATECKRNRTDEKYIKHASTFFSETTPFVDYLKKKEETVKPERTNESNPFR